MTVSYLNSPSFSAKHNLSEYNHTSPPESPVASSESSFSQRASSRASRTSVPAAAASASGPADLSTRPLVSSASAHIALDQSTGALGILIPNNRMEAGLSLRRSPPIPAKGFVRDPHPVDSDAPHLWSHSVFIDDAESKEFLYQTGFTGDIDLHGQFVYRRPGVDRASSHSKRRSQLILEDKYNRHRATTTSSDSELAQRPFIPSRRAPLSTRPEAAPQPHFSGPPHTPESASGRLESAPKATLSSSTGLRELSTESAAQPASKRASWLRRTRDFETRSDSHHLSHSLLPERVAPLSLSASTKASRRHSSFLSGDFRSAAFMPILTSNSFDVPEQDNVKRRSYITGKPRTPLSATFDEFSDTAGAPSSQRNSMLSNDSSATSSRGEAHVDFEADEANQHAHSSASSGFEHEEVLVTKPATTLSEGGHTVDSKNADVFTTPRSSTEIEKSTDATDEVAAKKPSSGLQTKSAPSKVAEPDAAAPSDVPGTDHESEAAPAIPNARTSQLQTAVVPPSPTVPVPSLPEHETTSTNPSGGLAARSESPSKFLSGRVQTSLDQRRGSSPGDSLGALAVPNGRSNGTQARRDSSTSIASAASSSSTYRIRRKAVPSDLDESERRQSVASLATSEAAEVSSLRSSVAPTPPPKDDAVHAIQASLISSGSVTSRMVAQNGASGDRMLDSSRERPSSASALSAKPGTSGLGFVKQTQASASSRDLSSSNTGMAGGLKAGAVRTASRATIKRPSTAPVGTAGQLRAASDAQKAMLEVEGMQFVLGKEEAKIAPAQGLSPSIPNGVRFLQPPKADFGRGAKRDSANGRNSRRSNNISTDTTGTSASGVAATSAPGSWGLEQELSIVDKVQGANGSSPSKASKPPRASLDKGRKSLDAANKTQFKNNMLMNIINEDESDEVKAAAREAGIPEGSYAIHPPSMLQLFESSQCLVYDQEGEEVLFGDLFKKRRTLVCFLRHWWCGFCQQFAMSVRNIDPLPLKKANLDFVIIGQGDWHVIKAYREVMQVQYPMFADPKRNVYRALGMTLRTNDANPVCARPDYASMGMTKGILVAIKKGLFDMPIRNPGDMKLLGGDFILGPGLQCSFTHRMTTADGHMDIPRILAQAGCDMSLKTPKPIFMLDEKATRSATLAGGNQNRRQTRSIGRSRGKMTNLNDASTMDTSFGPTAAAASIGNGATNTRSRPSVWGRFPGRFSRSQVSLPASASVVDVSTDLSHDRGLAAGPRSASAMQKISYDGRVRESFDTQQTDLQFESRATSFDTRGRPSDVSGRINLGSLNKAQSMSDLRKRFEFGGLSSFRSKLRQDSSKVSLDGRLSVPGSGSSRLQHNASSKSLRGAAAAQANGASTPTQQSVVAAKQANDAAEKANQSVSRSNVAASGLVAPATEVNGLGIDSSRTTGLSAPGSFLMDLDVYDSLSRQPVNGKPNGDNSKLAPGFADSGFSPTQASDSAFGHEAANSDSDTEPSLSATQTPARSQRGASGEAETGHTQSTSFQSFNTFRAQPLEHLAEETDEDGDDSRDQLRNKGRDSESSDEEDEGNDEPIEFERGPSGRF